MGNRKNIAVEVSSILVFGIGLFVILALLTYRVHDPSLFTAVMSAPHNACGRVGSYVSSFFLNCFGVGAFMVPAALFFIAATIYKREETVSVIGILGGMTISVSALTVFSALQWKTWSFGGGELLTGGTFGAWAADHLTRQLNGIGASLVTFLIFSVAFAVSTPISIAQLGAQAIARSVQFSKKFGRILFRILGGLIIFVGGMLTIRGIQAFGDLIKSWKNYWSERSKKISKAMAKSEAKSEGKGEVKAIHGKLASPPVPAIAREVNIRPEMEPDLGLEGEAELELKAITPPVETRPGAHAAVQASILDPLEKPAVPEKDASSPLTSGERIKILPREVDAALQTSTKISKPATPKVKRGQWKLPTIEFLKKPPHIESAVDRERLISNSQILTQKFADFGIVGEVTAVRPGPVITLYEFKPGPGVKVSRIAALADDLSMALSAQSVRILAPLPGKSVVGIEIPSENRETVYLREFLQHPDFYGTKHNIPVVMGKEIGGQTYLSDLARMPHLLCAGQTGSGKSVFMNGLICSLFYRFTPDELRMILVDPKFIEFRAYQDIPHLLLPVVDDPKHASTALKWAVQEMERRYRILARVGARNLAAFNQKVEEMGSEVMKDLLLAEDANSESSSASQSGGDWIEAFEPDETGAPRVGKLPFIVVIIDELADLMMIAKKEVEISIARIAQKARAAGIHLVIATQRPSTDVITGLIKANLPSRVSFQLASYVDSKTILDRAGAERLLGQGDMLFIPPGVSQTIRLHGAYLDDDEISKITAFLKSQGKPAYRDEILLVEDDEDGADGDPDAEDTDALFDEAVELVKRSGHASASFLQRHFKVGYNRAARMIETMEARGIVGPQDGARPREVLIR